VLLLLLLLHQVGIVILTLTNDLLELTAEAKGCRRAVFAIASACCCCCTSSKPWEVL